MIVSHLLNKSYGSYHALNKISCEIPTGKFIAVMGESGSGKSTFLNLISGIDSADSGSLISFEHQLVNSNHHQLAAYRRECVGIIFQDFNLLPTLSVWENVALPLKLKNSIVDEKWLNHLLDSVGVSRHKNKLPEQLSGGEQQRVSIARALAGKPKLLTADEPTGSLDSKTSKEVLELLQSVNEKFGITIVMATHSLQAASYASGILKIADGNLLESSVQ